jgi:carbon monoxide dehydrogenase subunit G
VQLINEFRVPVAAGRAWEMLTDVERIARCLPGAQLLSVDGDEFTGAVKVKVGPITAQYKGKAAFQEKDVAARRAVINANEKETRSQGNATAVVTDRLEADVLTNPAVAAPNDAPQPASETPHDDLLEVLAAPVAKRALPIAAGLLAGVAIGFLMGRRA